MPAPFAYSGITTANAPGQSATPPNAVTVNDHPTEGFGPKLKFGLKYFPGTGVLTCPIPVICPPNCHHPPPSPSGASTGFDCAISPGVGGTNPPPARASRATNSIEAAIEMQTKARAIDGRRRFMVRT